MNATFSKYLEGLPAGLQGLADSRTCAFVRGSHVYGTNTGMSDVDVAIVVPDSMRLASAVNGVEEVRCGKADYLIVRESDFARMMDSLDLMALESVWTPAEFYDGKRYMPHGDVDLWKLRQKISAVVNNSWAKCHKKLTVEKDYDWYRAVKSLFHCFRLYDFGIQIAKAGRITDYSSANGYWDELYTDDAVPSHEWNDYKAAYQKRLNALHSEFVALCQKPV